MEDPHGVPGGFGPCNCRCTSGSGSIICTFNSKMYGACTDCLHDWLTYPLLDDTQKPQTAPKEGRGLGGCSVLAPVVDTSHSQFHRLYRAMLRKAEIASACDRIAQRTTHCRFLRQGFLTGQTPYHSSNQYLSDMHVAFRGRYLLVSMQGNQCWCAI